MVSYAPPKYTLSGILKALEDPLHSCFERDFIDVACRSRGEAAALQATDRPGTTLGLPTRHLVRALKRDLTVGSASGAGDLSFATAVQVAAAARPELVLDRAGVPRLELLDATGPISFPNWVAENTPGGWVGEGGDASEINLTTRQVSASPKSSYGFVEISRRLRQAVDSMESLVLAELARSVAGTVETGFLGGSGSENQPLGLCNVPDAQSQSFGAAVPTRDELVSMLEKYTAAHGNLSRAVWVMTSAMAAGLLRSEVVGGTGQFILSVAPNGQPTVCGVPAAMSDYMPAGKLLLVDPSTLRSIYWGAPMALIDRYSGGRDLRGDSQLLVYNNVDIVAMHPSQIVVGAEA